MVTSSTRSACRSFPPCLQTRATNHVPEHPGSPPAFERALYARVTWSEWPNPPRLLLLKSAIGTTTSRKSKAKPPEPVPSRLAQPSRYHVAPVRPRPRPTSNGVMTWKLRSSISLARREADGGVLRRSVCWRLAGKRRGDRRRRIGTDRLTAWRSYCVNLHSAGRGGSQVWR